MTTRICPQCGTETQAPFCRADGFATVDSARYLPRDLHSREGETLAGRYRLDQVLGRTPLGSAYRATDLRLQAPVAVRLLSPGIATDLALIARFQREGRLVASLAHPNIVRVMEHGVAEDGTLYIAQELVAGPTLGEALARGGPFDPTRVVALGRELFDALAEAHTHGVLHRSLGLDNIVLVTRPGGGESLKISDFGLVHVLADDAPPGPVATHGAQPFVFPQVLAGAWRAMAPEQARGRGVSGHADLYSAGCLLYELLTGRPVFGDGTPSDLLVAHSVKMPPPPERDGRILTGPLVDLVMRCLEKKPWNRPDGAQKALDLLETCRVQPIQPLPNPTAEFAAPPANATSSQRVRPRTNPYGPNGVPAITDAAATATAHSPAPARVPGSTTRPTLRAGVQPTSLPTDPKGKPRPKPHRLRTAPEIGPAPRAEHSPTTGRATIAGASAARAEADRAMASRADLHPSGRYPDDPELAPRKRSPVLWFVAGVAVAAAVALAINALRGPGAPVEPREATVGSVQRSPGEPGAIAAVPEVAPPTPTATPAPAPAPADAAVVAAAPDVSPPPGTPDASSGGEPDARMGGPTEPATEPAAEPARAATERSPTPPRPDESLVERAPPPRPPPAETRPRERRERPARVFDPLADLEDPEFAGSPKAPEPSPGATAPTPARVVMHKVLIDSDPVGAKIAVSGRVVGETPMYVEWQGDGVDVVVSKDGYRPVRQRLGATTGRSLRFSLVPAN